MKVRIQNVWHPQNVTLWSNLKKKHFQHTKRAVVPCACPLWIHYCSIVSIIQTQALCVVRMWLDMWKLGMHRMIRATCHHHAIASLWHDQLFHRRSSGNHWLGACILSAFEPGVLQGTWRRDPRCWVPVKTPRHKVNQLRVVAVVKSRVK